MGICGCNAMDLWSGGRALRTLPHRYHSFIPSSPPQLSEAVASTVDFVDSWPDVALSIVGGSRCLKRQVGREDLISSTPKEAATTEHGAPSTASSAH